MIDRNPDHLHPIVREAVKKTIASMAARGIEMALFEGYRSPERQAALYAQGRTAPGPIVTYARPGESFHQYGFAADIVGRAGGAWTWALSEDVWQTMHAFGRTWGLVPLSFEKPHLELPGLRLPELRAGRFPPGGDASWSAIVRAGHPAPDVAPKPEVTPALSEADRLNQAELDRIRGATR